MKTIGETLQGARQRQNLSLDQVACKTHIRLDFLEALEKNDFGVLPSSAAVQGFIGTYAQLLGLDVQTALAMLRRDFEVRRENIVPKSIVDSSKLREHRPYWIKKALFIGTILAVVGLYGLWSWNRLHQPPLLQITSPKDNSQVSSTFILRGSTNSDAVVDIDNQPVAINQDGVFSKSESILPGDHIVTITAKNRQGQQTTLQLHLKVQP